ncbi:glucose-6-phosphate dehydrogenase [Nakamurella endophytica]|nr:glucose-6-phosphate dehydrogenase [Nakamurella endophytica]
MTSAQAPTDQSESGEPTGAAGRRPSTDAIVFVLFGATGDLAHRMVLPAFFQLVQHGLMPENYILVGNGRGDVSHENFRQRVQDSLTAQGLDLEQGPDAALWQDFAPRLRFAGGGFASDDPGSLLDVLSEARESLGTNARYIHYLAVPPVAFAGLTEGLAEHKLLDGARVVYEKPYGTSPDGFRKLDELVLSKMDESQVYRIDHFLGKEATQNLHVLRFANSMIGDIWNNRHVQQVQIDVPETLDVADRAQFYDATGAFRDMIVTHLFQVAAEVAMEPPVSFGDDDLQEAREAVIAAFRPLDPAEAVFGQAEGYRDLPDVADDSTTDTLAAVTLWIDTDRWHGVPFLLRSGKQLAESRQQVSLLLRKPDGPLTQVPGQGGVLALSLSGSGALELSLVLKKPGPGLELVEHSIDLHLEDIRGADPLPPYVALIHDVTIGDRTLFTSSAGLAQAWRVARPVLDRTEPPKPYAPGSWGPDEVQALPGACGWLVETDR